jgi:AraC family transcriptional regulator
LEDVAACAGVSRFHLTRAFTSVTGLSIMRYLRARRLTNAARSLAEGAADILSVAIDAGYGSHEAFTRAFRDQFGLTPEAIRAQGHLSNVKLLEDVRMNQAVIVDLESPRIETNVPMLLAGVAERYEGAACGAGIPSQWQRFGKYLGHVPGQIGNVAYGVCYNTDDEGNMDYLCAVEVADFSKLSAELTRLRIPAQRYAVFFHAGHISGIRNTWTSIWSSWLPQQKNEVADAPFFERYNEKFDIHSGNGGVELWVPLKD